ncbi:HlyD family secretion protein [Mucilaginibacter mallensis]|uniref:HlyD family secretion protein n=1 Tax=Mucilaginibacter mallensis TaxID=652787 RepID=A0A1H2ABU1_MUCMA|nr:biotin/lipoyl-binding protein [Mucilaginibacter mallensis]SDT43418.1 HlyD family secretion protein [Mucilaginibacter mallensis]
MDIVDQENKQKHIEEIQEIISAPPSWLLRWGITLFFAVLVLILAVSEIIQYPDVVQTTLKIRSLTLPHTIVAVKYGKLAKLLVDNNQEVKKGQILAVIKSDTGMINVVASQTGHLTYAGIIHKNQELVLNKVLFFIYEGGQDFFGEMLVPKASLNEVKEQQEVMIKLRSYPYQEYGIFHGKIKYITNSADNEDEYIAEVDFNPNNLTDTRKLLILRDGMMGDAGIITQNQTVLKRLMNNIFENINH